MEDLHCVGSGGTKVGKVINHKFGVRGHCTGILLHGSMASSSKTLFSRMAFQNTEVRHTIRWLGGGLAVVFRLLVGEFVLDELVLVELVASSVAFRSRK